MLRMCVMLTVVMMVVVLALALCLLILLDSRLGDELLPCHVVALFLGIALGLRTSQYFFVRDRQKKKQGQQDIWDLPR